jgi:CBS domain containing-hemolysin-like protein
MIEWLLIIITILLSGFFSGTEIAYVSSNRLKLEIKSRRDVFGAQSLAYFLRNPETFLSTTLIGNNIVNVTYATLLTLFMSDTLVASWFWLTGSIPGSLTLLVLKTTVASVIIMMLGEIIPKALFRTHPDSFIAVLAGPVRFISILLHPLVRVANATSGALIRLLHVDPNPQPTYFGRSDIELLFREIGDHSGSELDKDDSEILSNMLELSNIRVRESMIPRTDIVAIEKAATLDEARRVFISSGFSKLPVYDDSIDNVIGVVVAYDLFKHPKSLEAILRPVKHVPATQRSKDLLAEFRNQKLNMAIVIDEYGGTAGIITIEDLLEEVVGDIQDEYDVEDTILKHLTDTTWLLSGNANIDAVMEAYPQLRFPTDQDDYETIAGFVMHETGRIPNVNEDVVIGSFQLTITKGTRSRIELVKLQLLD